jgi:hypothetical protein
MMREIDNIAPRTLSEILQVLLDGIAPFAYGEE